MSLRMLLILNAITCLGGVIILSLVVGSTKSRSFLRLASKTPNPEIDTELPLHNSSPRASARLANSASVVSASVCNCFLISDVISFVFTAYSV